MESLWDMFTTVIYIAVPALVGVGLLAMISSWAIGLYQKMSTAQAEITKAHNEAQYDAALKGLELARQGVNVDLIRPDHSGLMPLPRAALDTYPRQLITLMSQHIDAQKRLPVMPQTLTYSPHFAAGKADQPKALDVAEMPKLLDAPAPEKPDLWKLYHQDQLPQDGFLLGMNTENGQPVVAGWDKLYSCLVGGVSGSGKTTLIRSLLAQATLQGARTIVCDPHYGAGSESLAASLKPLYGRMLVPPAGSNEAIKDALAYVNALIDRRLKDDGADREPVILVIDELTGIFNRKMIDKEVEYTLRLITSESRKTAVYALGIGQIFTNATIPTDVRNGFATAISCRTRRDMGRVMAGSNEFGKMAADLEIGQAVYQSPQGELIKLQVPNTTAKTLELVAASMGDGGHYVPSSVEANPSPIFPQSVALPEPAPTDGQDDPEGMGDGWAEDGSDHPATLKLDAGRIALVKALIADGKTKAEVLRAVWDVHPKSGGHRYKTASAGYDQIVTAIVKGL